jgi:steroid 5-alpha reductase family enzyme
MDKWMILIFVQILILLFAYATVWFLISLIIKRNDVADIAWGLGYCFLCIYLFLAGYYNSISLVIFSLTIIWGLRLSVHIYLRNRGKKEDFRYQQWREEWGNTFYWRSFLQVYLLQVFLLYIISSPIVLASISTSYSWNWLTTAGLSFWIIGFIWQTISDYQLTIFVKNKKHKNEIMNTGLWKYSRHPNYFGEILIWWGIYIMIIPFDYSYYFVISPITITLLLNYVSGVPMLEKKYDSNEAYQDYKKKVPAILPKLL